MINVQPRALVIFDLDGVITTEHIYWECARLTLWELLQVRLRVMPYVPAVHDAVARRGLLPDGLIFAIKNRAINSNWDLTFLGLCAAIRETACADGPVASVPALMASLARRSTLVEWPGALTRLLADLGARRGEQLIVEAGRQAGQASEAEPGLFDPGGPVWSYGYERFQLWYDGLLTGVWGAAPLRERPVVSADVLSRALCDLRGLGCEPGIATGRPAREAQRALRELGMHELFSPAHVATYDDVEQAQRLTGSPFLGKPHPFVIRRALYPDRPIESLVGDSAAAPRLPAIMVGDSTSDALAARGAGIPCLGVLSGVVGENARQERCRALLDAGCLDTVEDIQAVPGWISRWLTAMESR